MRQIVLDTETTGLEVSQGHRIIEIGCVELDNRRLTGNHFHRYIKPDREIDQGAIEVHGITNEFLADKPRFAQVAADFMEFIEGAELVIHNAPFDLGFLNSELQRLDAERSALEQLCPVIDTLVMARSRHPGQRNNLDALCQRYGVDNSQRDLHGALLDAEILADVYLAMTGGQTAFQLSDSDGAGSEGSARGERIRRLPAGRPALPVIAASAEELAAHEAQLDAIAAGGGRVIWRD
ncbi:DNA polymerase III subunit epsilon [Mangrovimicrobium sediminis]|uniref:DNA polymerase III subunit epsilon n=1 Tax=Mangrovimicrobium sediminis TaxID=2562682 RepID=A0A4Z0M7D1_9GAMM|nr:DNA polymerase III subunit epsilon [Haliea sp. SAOS-164]TGD75318.1 DNA polymerase III subunit epsilon [Haliea sp. SAOS-164]